MFGKTNTLLLFIFIIISFGKHNDPNVQNGKNVYSHKMESSDVSMESFNYVYSIF